MGLKLNKNLFPLAVMPFIILVCIGLWLGLSAEHYSYVSSQAGTWDLSDFDFKNDNVRLQGEVEFIPNALLSPEEFSARENEIIIGFPADSINAVFFTSRTASDA